MTGRPTDHPEDCRTHPFLYLAFCAFGLLVPTSCWFAFRFLSFCTRFAGTMYLVCVPFYVLSLSVHWHHVFGLCSDFSFVLCLFLACSFGRFVSFLVFSFGRFAFPCVYVSLRQVLWVEGRKVMIRGGGGVWGVSCFLFFFVFFCLRSAVYPV